jgi:hypothetical protein
MHPVCWFGRYLIPVGMRLIKQINIPRYMTAPSNSIGDFFADNLILIIIMLESFIGQELNRWKCGFNRIIIKYWNPND